MYLVATDGCGLLLLMGVACCKHGGLKFSAGEIALKDSNLTGLSCINCDLPVVAKYLILRRGWSHAHAYCNIVT